MKNDVDKQVNIIVSDAKAQAEEVVAEGERQYMQLLAETFNTAEKENFYIFMRSLETRGAARKHPLCKKTHSGCFFLAFCKEFARRACSYIAIFIIFR